MGEKYILTFDPIKRYDRLCHDLIYNLDYSCIKDEKEKNLVKASLGVFKKNCHNVRSMIEDVNCPLHNISCVTLDTVFRHVKFITEIDIKNKFRHRPLPLMQTLLILVVVSGCYKTPERFLTSTRNMNNLMCGNFEEMVGKGHTVEILRSLCKFGKESKYWDRVQKYLDFVI